MHDIHNVVQIHNDVVMWDDWQCNAEHCIVQTECEKYFVEYGQSHIITFVTKFGAFCNALESVDLETPTCIIWFQRKGCLFVTHVLLRGGGRWGG